jgi:hypothetical protein
MRWDIPRFEMIKMDAEIGSYQEEDPGPFFVAPAEAPSSLESAVGE